MCGLVQRRQDVRNDSDVYRVVAAIWCDILGVDTVQASDSFFNLAGTSIAAELIASRICEALPVAMTGSDVLRGETLSNVVTVVASRLR
jgi:hypothetical protein